MNRVLIIIIAVLFVLFTFSVMTNIIQGQYIAGSLKKEYKFNDYMKETQNALKLQKDFENFLLNYNEKDYNKYKFDPVFFNKKASYDNIPIIIYTAEYKNETDFTKYKIKSDLYIYGLLNQVFYKCNYIDLRR
ncbi:MAG: hypothetical protein EHM12_08190 [Dehalococcoidia bacterium]|nr:MAG: hypothetical protein EHM12_08190 [Dehalococcoidia bacterium]